MENTENTVPARSSVRLTALKAAFPHTIPIMAGFLFLGIAYGIYMNVSGFSFVYPMLTALLVYGGSLEFVIVSMLLAPFAPLQAFLMTLMIQARHLFYGISMLDRFKDTGWKKYYLIFGLCDETFSINYTAEIPEGVDKGWFMFFVTLLNQIYWVAGSTLGGIFGSFISFNTEGLGFVMAAMFVVIFLSNWEKEDNHTASLVGLAAAAACRLFFSADDFMIPTMIAILCGLTLLRQPLERGGKVH